ncbi:PIG-L family deacetylase [Candidatus Dojkabacteria bacterium]|nr:PIG-L family deacetylase [Candidatus Dojkabacteria bacterium]
MSPEEERLQIQDNLNEFLTNNPQIRNITFVFAHPDDIEGYAGGLVNRLATINEGKVQEDKYSLNFVVVTDGANGTQDVKDRDELIRTRQQEQLEGLKVLFNSPKGEEANNQGSTQQGHQKYVFTQSNASVTFLNHPDSNVDEERLVDELDNVLKESGGDLIITHDKKEWGRPVSEKNPYLAVQNHSDHRKVSKAMLHLIGKLEDAGVEDIPILLRSKWEESDISVSFDGNIKKSALAEHNSQYIPNQVEMDRIVDELNAVESERFEFYEVVNPDLEFKKRLKRTLLNVAGEQAKVLMNREELLTESFKRFHIENIMLIGEVPDDNWKFDGTTPSRFKIDENNWDRNIFERYIREHNIDFLVIPADLPDNILDDIHAVMMFLSSVSHKGFEELKPHKIKGAAYAIKGTKGITLKQYLINIGLW